jgi:hypothetical protein
MTQESWSGVDLVIHCGGSVDLSMTLQDAMSSLARAEVLKNQVGQRKENEFNRLMQQAEEQLRDAYRWHWSSSASSANMGHGSHLFCCSSALVDLLSAAHYSSIGNLINDYSKVRETTGMNHELDHPMHCIVIDVVLYCFIFLSFFLYVFSFVSRKQSKFLKNWRMNINVLCGAPRPPPILLTSPATTPCIIWTRAQCVCFNSLLISTWP